MKKDFYWLMKTLNLFIAHGEVSIVFMKNKQLNRQSLQLITDELELIEDARV